MDTEKIEGNLFIAGFMGAEQSTVDGDRRYFRFPKKQAGTEAYAFKKNELKYHCDWNWLIPVVENINQICHDKGCELSNKSREQQHLENQLDNPLHWKSWSYHYVQLSTNINEVWNKVVKFIEWYNTTQQLINPWVIIGVGITLKFFNQVKTI